jgi:acetyl esterase/lipase
MSFVGKFLIVALSFLIVATGLCSTTVKEIYAYSDTGVALYWTKFQPDGPGPFLSALVVHAGGFKLGVAGPTAVCRDLANNGVMAYAVEYRLAPSHTPMNYPNHPIPAQNTVVPKDNGHFPEQTDDIRTAIRIARADPLSNHKIVILGGSAGGAHALYWAGLGTLGDDMPDAIVLCSGVYEYDDLNHLQVDYPPGETNFHSAVMNYLGRVDNFPNYSQDDLDALHAASPIYFIHQGMPPIYFMVSSDDAGGVDTFDFPDLMNALNAAGIPETTSSVPEQGTYKQTIIPVSRQTHAFEYWSQAKSTIIPWVKGLQ